eukprot:m.204366 g.204366  ORF g.204366 m.204366 type:complete len:219 (+) comp18871_c0_seq25:1790-2446(+)
MEPLGVDPAQARRYDMTDVVKADEVFADKLQDFWTTVKRRGLAPNAGIDVTMLPTCALSPRAFLHSLGAAIQHACIPATPSASPVDRLMSVAQWYFHVLQSGFGCEIPVPSIEGDTFRAVYEPHELETNGVDSRAYLLCEHVVSDTGINTVAVATSASTFAFTGTFQRYGSMPAHFRVLCTFSTIKSARHRQDLHPLRNRVRFEQVIAVFRQRRRHLQ